MQFSFIAKERCMVKVKGEKGEEEEAERLQSKETSANKHR